MLGVVSCKSELLLTSRNLCAKEGKLRGIMREKVGLLLCTNAYRISITSVAISFTMIRTIFSGLVVKVR